ncbi:MAG TPA: hypothetical protein VH560_03100 [Polyangia bacterium]|jgi:hypothetical protein|nr:hypothetical protein [Polyangia bacterium]
MLSPTGALPTGVHQPLGVQVIATLYSVSGAVTAGSTEVATTGAATGSSGATGALAAVVVTRLGP